MSVSKPIHAFLFLLFIFSVACIKLSYCIQSSPISCPEIEKYSLLTLKKSLKDDCHLLSSWDGEVDCCKWKGVVCNNSTGHVHQLRLQGNWWERCLSGKINPSLINLKHLTYLDLSLNDFSGETIPTFIGSFKSLEYLDLYEAGFQGRIPHTIGNLSNLRALNLSGSYNDLLKADSLEWLSELSKLEYLRMESVNLIRATNWAQVINNLPSLLEVEFSGCDLDFTSPVNNVNLSTSLTLLDLSDQNENFNTYNIGPPVPQWFFQLNNLLSLDLRFNSFIGQIPTVSNATKLQHIDLSFNNFNSSIPDSIYFCKDLEFLSLSSNYLHGKISDSIANLTSLQTVDLADNQLSGKLPKGITNLCNLQSLDISFNELQGDLFGSMSECFLGSLEELRLDDNKFYGHLIDQFGEFKSLRELDLGYNSLSGAIPISLGNLSSLRWLALDDSKFTGNIPESLGQLLNLEFFNIENNKLEGIVTESHFASLSKLTYFSASGNHITLNVGPDWIPPFQLATLELGSWSLGEGLQIPAWIQKQRNIVALDLSNTGISGNIPSSFLNIQFLNVSNNNLNGSIPHISFKYEGASSLFLSSNKFSGSLPRIHKNLFGLDLSHNMFSEGISDFFCDTTFETYGLQLLHLEGNRLSGELPDCWEKWPYLTYLKLGNNTMSGRIPNTIGFLAQLKSLSLYGNKFSGKIPLSMRKCRNLLKIDLSHNNLDGHLPTWMGTSFPNLRILILRSNKLGGEISSEICHLQSLQILDLSNNRISGIIPRCLCNFSAMATMMVLKDGFFYDINNFTKFTYYTEKPPMESASVMTKGVESEYNTILWLVTNIDLSMNNLSGEIPKELTSLVELRSLNLSGNHFTGSIPESIGDMKQLESLDLSRNSLSGQIPNGLALLSSLSYLNLSFNKLSGRIPESTQLSTMEASSFMGNNLCGPQLARNCSSSGDEVHGQKEEKQGEKSEIKWLYVFLSLGYAIGFSAVCTALVLKKSWRYAYFGLLECVWDDIYVYFYVKWAKFRKQAAAPGSRS